MQTNLFWERSCGVKRGAHGKYSLSPSSDHLIRFVFREEALRIFQKSPFFGAWDPEVLKVYIECGTYPTRDLVTGEPIVRLKMPGIQEGIVFSETHTEFEVFQRLPSLKERIPLRWIVPGKPGAGEYVFSLHWRLLHLTLWSASQVWSSRFNSRTSMGTA